jgi:hypothetical protein
MAAAVFWNGCSIIAVGKMLLLAQFVGYGLGHLTKNSPFYPDCALVGMNFSPL